MLHRLRCSEVWGGIRDEDLNVHSSGVCASLVSLACEGGKGGDIYFLSLCGTDLLTRIVVADVVGHGEGVSAVSQALFEALQAHMNRLDGNGILLDLNHVAEMRGLSAMTTAGVAGFYKSDSTLYFSYAGHPEILLQRKVSGGWERVSAASDGEEPFNLPLGVLAETRYPQETLELSKGDRLVMYTDGVTEAPNSQGDLFGLDRLLGVLNDAGGGSVKDIKEAVLRAIRKHTGGALHHDDVTLLVMEIL